MLKKPIKLIYFVLLFSAINLVLYNIPVYRYALDNLDIKSLNGILLVASLTIAALISNALLFYLLLFLFRVFGKGLMVVFFITNSIALYFINTYGAMIDKTMIGNIFNTNFEEASSFFSFTLIPYIVLLGILPSILLFKIKTIYPTLKKFSLHVILTLIFLLSFAYVNSKNWLWIDKNSKNLGSLVMPWCYLVNINLYYNHKNDGKEKQLLLPNATIKDNKKSIAILVIGESARSEDFSLYGYKKNTNPLLSKIENVHIYKAESSATYTTAGVKSILEYKDTNEPYEILPNYLFRNDVGVFWRTTNSGEPKVNIKSYQNKDDLEKLCKGDRCDYDEVLLNGLKEQILACKRNKILVILHTSTSHGPSYYKKYPPQFNKFTPVCESVELANCSHQELTNAYDNTIVYTDYILATLIGELKELKDYNSCMIYLSDHGESLGEDNLYMHGIPNKHSSKTANRYSLYRVVI
jgi:lipid A ethanolaminephosphotransferase